MPVNPISGTTEYTILKGQNQTYTKGSNKDILIVASGDLDKLQEIEIDNGNVIDSSNYVLERGSTKLILKSTFLENTSVGKHTITFKNNDSEVSTKLTIANANNTNQTTANNTSNPQTGDNIIFYFLMLGLSIIGFAGTGIYLKKDLTSEN